MSETRYSPEQLESRAEFSFAEDDEVSDMLQQAARDARVIAQLRTWLEKNRDTPETDDQLGDGSIMASNALAELDRLTREPTSPSAPTA